MKKSNKKFIDKLFSECKKYVEELNNLYHFNDSVVFTIFGLSFFKDDGDRFKNTLMNDDTTMSSIVSYEVDINGIVQDVSGYIFMSYQSLFELILDVNMNFNKTLECMKFLLRHEFGHIICNREYIGKHEEEIDKFNMEVQKYYKELKQPRKNASLQTMITWSLEYNQLPMEKSANDEVGITEDDIITYVNNRHREY